MEQANGSISRKVLAIDRELVTAEAAIEWFISMIDENSSREGLRDTPKRVVKFYEEFLNPEPFNFTVFESEGMDEMVTVWNIPFFSLCEHHMAPFFGFAHIGYIPNGKICGLSKIPRTLDLYARRLQNQERITQQVAEHLFTKLQPLGVGIVIEARHLCVEMRGVKKHDTWTTTSKMMGCFRENEARAEFLQLVNQKRCAR